ncbi:MAG: thioether cross-link-forming SCIFF peptide maturase [Bacillota bacterium]|nr:thioether cross-link-forming SCIFF peptide maturase [Bacillota bacterium]
MVHIYKQNGFNIVLDVNSGAVHNVDELAYDILEVMIGLGVETPAQNQPEQVIEKLKGKYAEKDIIEAYGDIFELYKAGLLFSSDNYLDVKKLSNKKAPVKALCLHIAHDCNLRCRYCFADTGEYNHKRELMSFEVGKAAIDFLIKQSESRRNLEVDFFGGEPLMNFEVVKQIVKYAKGLEKEHNKNFRFTVTTNGVLLDDKKMAFINEYMSNVVLSIDGRKEVNDKVRIRVDGTGCYDSILPKFQEMARLRGQMKYYVRGTFTRYNLDFDNDVMHLAEQGFDQISVEPVAAQEDADYSIRKEDLTVVFNSYDRLAKKMLDTGRKFNFFHFMIDLKQGPCVIKRIRGCGSGNEYLAIAPSGDIYPCHQFVGHDEFYMGNIIENSFNEKIKNQFATYSIFSKPECMKCWAKYYCSGGCNANNYLYEGDITKSYKIACEMEKKRVECAIMMKVAEAD